MVTFAGVEPVEGPTVSHPPVLVLDTAKFTGSPVLVNERNCGGGSAPLPWKLNDNEDWLTFTNGPSLITRVNGITSGLFAAPGAVSVMRPVHTPGRPAMVTEGT